MVELPQHPQDGSVADIERRAPRSRRTYAVGVVVVALIALMLVLHLTEVLRAGSH
jgi:hypothetical protein